MMTANWRKHLARAGLVAAAILAILVVPRGVGAQGAQGVRWTAAPDEFRAGDRVLLYVEGEKALTDTFTVAQGPALELPEIGHLSLAGVRRTEVQAYLTREIGKYLKGPVVHAVALMRVGILGEVTRPGYYNVPADILVSDLFTVVGGPTKESRMDKARVNRAGAVAVKSDSLSKAIARGLTIAQIGLRSGDDLQVPRATDSEHVWRIIAIVVMIPSAIYGGMLLFK